MWSDKDVNEYILKLENIEIKNCPYCRSNHISLEKKRDDEYRDSTQQISLFCECGVRAPFEITEFDETNGEKQSSFSYAIEKWNRFATKCRK